MSNFIRIGIFVLCLALLAGCSSNHVAQHPSEYMYTYEESTDAIVTTIDQFDCIQLSSWKDCLEQSDGTTINVLEANLNELVILQNATDSSTVEKASSCYLLGRKTENTSPFHYSYLVIDTIDSDYIYNLGTVCLEGEVYMCDVDGDKICEVIMHQMLDSTGGAGQYLSRVFKYDHGEIYEIFNSKESLPLYDFGMGFDTGFSSEFADGYKLKVINKYVDKEIFVDISNRYISEIFDENGKCTKNESIWVDRFFRFVPKDVDNDGVFEIECLQYASLFSHAGGVGHAKSVLKYDTKEQVFKVVDADFIT